MGFFGISYRRIIIYAFNVSHLPATLYLLPATQCPVPGVGYGSGVDEGILW